ncbi:phospholipase D-like domain-containing protein [Acaryochloris thomasi]|uniref:hypothetical protein n=1 Tax=Acaryochloris thomasi TaxID=2929456 RepID=UPI001F4013A3|nr:hypothetical protein [Acaryochloris thomasi]
MARQHSNLRLKAIGTHEKFLVCDRSFAMIGTHNFLTPDDGSQERQVSLRTTDQNAIHQRLQSYEDAPTISPVKAPLLKLKNNPTELSA